MISPPTSAGPAAFYFRASRQPMLWAAAAYALGIIAGTYAWRPIFWWFVATAMFVSAAAFFSTRRPIFAWLLALSSFFLAGALHIEARSSSNHLDTSIQQYADREELQIVAHVTRDGRLRQEERGEARQSLDVEAEQIQTASGQVVLTHSGIRLSIYSPRSEDSLAEGASPVIRKNDSGRVFHYGERVRFIAKLKIPRNFRNPGAFDYQSYLADRGIAALGTAKLGDVELLPGFTGNRIASWRSQMHRSVIAKVHELWPPRQAALIDAMVLGDEAFIDRDTRVDFQRSGTYHVLVVSGMNVSILAFVIFWTLRRLRVGEIPATLLTIAFCIAYALITEVGAPVWRATLMCAVYLATRVL